MERVVITGLGAITPLGLNSEDTWNGMKYGKCGIHMISGFDTENYKVKLAAEIKDFKAENFMDKKKAKRMDRFCQFAMVAGFEALQDSNLNIKGIDPERFSVIIGSGVGGISTIEEQHYKLIEKGPSRVSPFLIPMLISNMAAGNIAIEFGAKGISNTVVTACASGTNAIGEAFRLIKHGYSDVVITGGTEAAITPLAIAGFDSMNALSTSNNPCKASIPFDKDRVGFVMGEGAGVIIVESLKSAIERNAKIYCEIIGYGATCDAYHMTTPAPLGEGAARAINLALKEGGIAPEEISYINAHGTSTYYNDKFETEAIKSVFGENSYKIPVSSTKSMTGHLLGAAGAVETIACAKALSEGYIPPTIGYTTKDPECDLDYVTNKGRQQKLKFALSNSLGFGGHNAVLLFKLWEE